MAGRRVSEDLLELEVREETDLLRHHSSFAGLRDVLGDNGIPASAVILAGLIEAEDLSRYGVILTPGRECIVFETAPDESLIRWEVIDEPATLTGTFQAVLVGIAMVCDGRIA